MTPESFKASLQDAAPPTGASVPLQALWHAARDEWDTAHGLAQSDEGKDAAWVHAHLHRIEGGLANAGYWYARADRPASDAALEAEWAEIVGAIVGR